MSSELSSPFPNEVGFVSVYSRSDGIVDWRSCLDPAARCAEIDSSHCGMSAHPQAYREVEAALSEFAGTGAVEHRPATARFREAR